MYFLFGPVYHGGARQVREIDFNSAILQNVMRAYPQGFITEDEIVLFISEYAHLIEPEEFNWIMGVDYETGQTTSRYKVVVEYSVSEVE